MKSNLIVNNCVFLLVNQHTIDIIKIIIVNSSMDSSLTGLKRDVRDGG